MKKKLVMMLLTSCILTSTFSLTAYADEIEFETEEIVYDEDISDDDISYDSYYSQTHSIKEEELQKAVDDLEQFKSNLKDYKKNIKLIKAELKKSKINYSNLKMYYKNAKKSFKNADESLTLIKDDLYKLSVVYDLIEMYLDPDMGYTRTDEDLQQASLDYTEVKEYLKDTRNYLKQFKKYDTVTSESFKGDLIRAKNRVDFVIKTKDSKRIKTSQKLKSYPKTNSYGFKDYVDYGFYSDDTISSQIKTYNKYRKSKKLPAMKNNPKLNKAAAMLALEHAVGNYSDKEDVDGFDYKRPDGSSYTTAIKECGIKNFKSAGTFYITVQGERDYSDFIKDALSYDMYNKGIKGNQYTEYGIGYYSTLDGGLQTWFMILVQK